MEHRRSQHKAVPDLDKKRGEELSVLRKKKRQEGFQEKRRMTDDSSPASPVAFATADLAPRAHVPELPTWLAQLDCTTDPSLVLSAITSIRKLVSRASPGPYIDMLIPHLASLTRFLHAPFDAHADIQLQALWIFTNIAGGESYQTESVASPEIVAQLCRIFDTCGQDAKSHAVWCIGNIAGDSLQRRDQIASTTIIRSIGMLLSSSGPFLPGLLRNAVWCLVNIARGKPRPDFSPMVAILPQLLSVVVPGQEEDVIVDAAVAVSYMSEDRSCLEGIARSGWIQRAMQILAHPKAVLPAIRILGNVLAGEDHLTQAVMDAGIMAHAPSLLANKNSRVRKDACWAISNIPAGTLAQTVEFCKTDIPRIVISACLDDEFDVVKEAIYVIHNISFHRNADMCRFLVRIGLFDKLGRIMSMDNDDVLHLVLSTLGMMLEAGEDASTDAAVRSEFCAPMLAANLAERIEELQEHPNNDVHELAYNIVSAYFSDVGDASEETSPTAPPTAPPSSSSAAAAAAGSQVEADEYSSFFS
jgi:hypothetical protein